MGGEHSERQSQSLGAGENSPGENAGERKPTGSTVTTVRLGSLWMARVKVAGGGGEVAAYGSSLTELYSRVLKLSCGTRAQAQLHLSQYAHETIEHLNALRQERLKP